MLAFSKRKEVARGERIVNNRMGLDGEAIVSSSRHNIGRRGWRESAGRAAAVI